MNLYSISISLLFYDRIYPDWTVSWTYCNLFFLLVLLPYLDPVYLFGWTDIVMNFMDAFNTNYLLTFKFTYLDDDLPTFKSCIHHTSISTSPNRKSDSSNSKLVDLFYLQFHFLAEIVYFHSFVSRTRCNHLIKRTININILINYRKSRLQIILEWCYTLAIYINLSPDSFQRINCLSLLTLPTYSSFLLKAI